MSHGHCLRLARWDSVGDAATEDGLWLWNELLATIARLAGARDLATAPFRFARLAGALRTARLVTGDNGRQFGPGSFWGRQTGPNPTDRAKPGSKRHLICDSQGVPLAIQLTGANRNDSQQALSLDECSLSNYTFDLGDVLMRHALSEEASAPGLQRGRAAHVGTPSQIANRAEEAYGTRGDLAGLVRRSE